MGYLESILFGAVQGLAEFLPISSSGHLLLLHNITHFRVLDDLAFDIALHAGTLLALLAMFWRDIIRLAKAWFRSLRHWSFRTDQDQRLAWLIIIGTVPGMIAGVLLESKAETAFRAPVLVASALIVMGVVLWAIDRWAKQEKTIEHSGFWTVLWIGIAQAAAVIPGVSRAGATMTASRALGLTREAAAKLSFYLAIPIVAGAAAVKLPDVLRAHLTATATGEFLVGMATAAVVGAFTIRFLLRYISRHSYGAFAVYRVALGILVLVLVALKIMS